MGRNGEKSMNTREFLNAVILANVSEDVTTFAQAELAKIDAKNTKRRTTKTKAQAANDDIKTIIITLLNEETPMTAAQVATATEISTQKASALLTQLVKENALITVEVKNEKKNKVKGYLLPKTETADQTETDQTEQTETGD